MSARAEPRTVDTLAAPVGTVLVFATGFAEAYIFLRQGHVFAQAMTGNLVLIAFGATGSSTLIWWYPVVVFLAFIVGVAALWVLARWGPALGRAAGAVTLALLAVVLIVVGVAGQSLHEPIAAVAVAFCGGLEIAAFRRIGATNVTAVVMTSNTFRAVEAVLEALFSGGPREVAVTLVGAVLAYTLGALGSAWACTQIGDHAGWVAGGLFLVTLAMFLFWPERAPGATPDATAEVPSSA